MSGTTRSMPNISSSGNIRPQSMTTMSSPYSKTNMFLPISPTPPSGMIRSGVPVGAGGWLDFLGMVVLSDQKKVGASSAGSAGPASGGDGVGNTLVDDASAAAGCGSAA